MSDQKEKSVAGKNISSKKWSLFFTNIANICMRKVQISRKISSSHLHHIFSFYFKSKLLKISDSSVTRMRHIQIFKTPEMTTLDNAFVNATNVINPSLDDLMEPNMT